MRQGGTDRMPGRDCKDPGRHATEVYRGSIESNLILFILVRVACRNRLVGSNSGQLSEASNEE